MMMRSSEFLAATLDVGGKPRGYFHAWEQRSIRTRKDQVGGVADEETLKAEIKDSTLPEMRRIS